MSSGASPHIDASRYSFILFQSLNLPSIVTSFPGTPCGVARSASDIGTSITRMTMRIADSLFGWTEPWSFRRPPMPLVKPAEPFVKPPGVPRPEPLVIPRPAPFVSPLPTPLVMPRPAPFVRPFIEPFVTPRPEPLTKPLPRPFVIPLPEPLVKPFPVPFVNPLPLPLVKPRFPRTPLADIILLASSRNILAYKWVAIARLQKITGSSRP